MEKEEIHINEYFGDVYFEPLQEVLNFFKAPLFTSFDLVMDRNTIRKISAAIENEEDYQDFVIFIRKHENTIILKREEQELNGNRIGLVNQI